MSRWYSIVSFPLVLGMLVGFPTRARLSGVTALSSLVALVASFTRFVSSSSDPLKILLL
jgi:hypothetical protein